MEDSQPVESQKPVVGGGPCHEDEQSFMMRLVVDGKKSQNASEGGKSHGEGTDGEKLLTSVCGDVVDRTFSILPDLLSRSVDAHLDRLRRNVALHNFDAMQVAEMAPQKLRQVQRGERKAKKVEQKMTS